jgi:D-alanine-D-alanine ligase
MKVGLSFNLKKDLETYRRRYGNHLPDDFFAECDSAETIEAVRAALAERHEVVLVEGDEDALEKFRSERPDIVFNMAEGVFGAARESHIPAVLEMLGIPYHGSDPLTLAICLDKARTKDVLAQHGILTPRYALASSTQELREEVGRSRRGNRAAFLTEIAFPLFVKPACEGSSKGIVNDALVRDETALSAQLERIHRGYRQPALVEEYLPGREFTVAIIGNHPDLQVLPIVEIRFDTLPAGVNPVYSFEAKWVWDTAEEPLEIFECPARLEPELQAEIEHVCTEAYRVLRVRDWCRIDVRLDARGRPHVLELNPLPGVLPKPEDNSCFPKAARAAGMSFNQLINRVFDVACQRYGLRPSCVAPVAAGAFRAP